MWGFTHAAGSAPGAVCGGAHPEVRRSVSEAPPFTAVGGGTGTAADNNNNNIDGIGSIASPSVHASKLRNTKSYSGSRSKNSICRETPTPPSP
jgi:hypothetical protein